MTDDDRSVSVEVGALWEGTIWFVHFDAETSTYRHTEIGPTGRPRTTTFPEKPCPHAEGIHDEEPVVYPAGPYGRKNEAVEVRTVWTVPRVVVAYNEGGYASTGVCLDCILEWAAANPREPT